MTRSDNLTYTALFAAILATQLGTRHPSLDRVLLPVVIVGAIGFGSLHSLPGGPTSHLLELAGLGAGLVFGLASIPLFRVGKDERGRLTTTAGAAYAALWLAALAARLAFATARATGSTARSSPSRPPTTCPPPPTPPPSC